MEYTFDVQDITGVSKTDFTEVQEKDIDGKNYVNGCQGQLKEIIERDKNNNIMRTTTLYYRSVEYPTFVSQIVPINS